MAGEWGVGRRSGGGLLRHDRQNQDTEERDGCDRMRVRDGNKQQYKVGGITIENGGPALGGQGWSGWK